MLELLRSHDHPLIVMVNPSNGFYRFYDNTPPWALIYASVNLCEYRVIIIDQNKFGWEKKLSDALSYRPSYIGVTALTGTQISNAINILELARLECPDIISIWGGIHGTIEPDTTIKHHLVDYLVQGDGEDTLKKLLDELRNGNSEPDIPGVWYISKQGQIIRNITHPGFYDLSNVNNLPIDLISPKGYISTRPDGSKWANVITSKGCVFKCAFCYDASDFNRSKWRAISAEYAVELCNIFVNAGSDGIVFIDDNFWVSKQRVDEFLLLIQRQPSKFLWQVQGANFNNIKKYTVSDFKEFYGLGLRQVTMGIETIAPRTQEVIRKKQNPDDILFLTEELSRANIKTCFSFMAGFPHEDDIDIKYNINFILKLRKISNLVSVGNVKPFMPYPGTEMFDIARKNGFVAPITLEGWSEYTFDQYDKTNIPWVNSEKKKLLGNLYIVSTFLNPGYTFIQNRLSKTLFAVGCYLLMPLTLWRLKNLNLKYSLRSWIIRKLHDLFSND